MVFPSSGSVAQGHVGANVCDHLFSVCRVAQGHREVMSASPTLMQKKHKCKISLSLSSGRVTTLNLYWTPPSAAGEAASQPKIWGDKNSASSPEVVKRYDASEPSSDSLWLCGAQMPSHFRHTLALFSSAGGGGRGRHSESYGIDWHI